MKTLLWLDDYRDPLKDDWLVFSPIEQPYGVIWVKSYSEFINWIKDNGLPTAICFDHDLGKDIELKAHSMGLSKRASRKLKVGIYTGMDCAKFIVEYCMDNNLKLPLYNIQSANPVGKENIDGLLKSFIKNSNK